MWGWAIARLAAIEYQYLSQRPSQRQRGRQPSIAAADNHYFHYDLVFHDRGIKVTVSIVRHEKTKKLIVRCLC